ncbi:MAG: hypothetical protein IJ324_08830 [Lachnospiraceae bacterium]|nr:hypothetical protein [Lachnospiraceae bacterium]
MKRKHIGRTILIALTFVGILAGCGSVAEQEVVQSSEVVQEVTPSPQPTAEPTPEPTPLTVEGMIAERELRLEQGLFVEEDYVSLAELYAQVGNEEARRETIYRVLRLYPSEEYIDMLSDMVKTITLPDEQAQGMLTELEGYLASEDLTNAKAVLNGEQWNSLFRGELDVITGKTRLVGDEVCYQVETDALETELTVLYTDGRVKYFKTNAEGSCYFEGTWAENGYVGDFTHIFWDSVDGMQSRYHGTLQDGYCVDELTVLYDGTTYTGEFTADGTTKEKQIDKVKKKNQVIYAYNSKKTKYLYVEEADVADWKLTMDKFGFPVIEEWK